jgi:ATP-dependent Clp protease ATP-binding subunit ClpA
MVLAQEEARFLDHDYIGTEHILISIAHEGEGLAAKVLANLNISETTARATALEIVGRGVKAPPGHIPFTPRSKRVLEYSLREALQLGNNYIGTEHLLLGIIQDGEGVAAQVLVKLGADLPKLRQLVCNRQRSGSVVSDFLAGDGEPFLPKMPGRKHHLLGELENLLDENDRLYEQVRRLREKLRQHNIDPDN